MKTIKTRMLIGAVLMAASLIFSADASAQTRKLPDGTIIYPDGTRRLPNGTVIYKDGGNGDNRNGTVTLPDGRVIYGDGRENYPNDRKHKGHRKNNNGQWMPPGQAKKIYGGSAKDYAPGQQKKGNGNKGWKKKHKE